jgi:hypothetical protein
VRDEVKRLHIVELNIRGNQIESPSADVPDLDPSAEVLKDDLK